MPWREASFPRKRVGLYPGSVHSYPEGPYRRGTEPGPSAGKRSFQAGQARGESRVRFGIHPVSRRIYL